MRTTQTSKRQTLTYRSVPTNSIPPVGDAVGLANHLGVTTQGLWHTVLFKNDFYEIKAIKKSSGKKRIIHIPDARLKMLQRSCLVTFVEEIAYEAGMHVGAYVRGRSTRFTAAQHVGKKLLICMDIENFFPSVKRAMIRNFYMRQAGMNEEPAGLLAQIMTYKNFVPQGAPSSGAIANVIAHWKFDRKLLELAYKRKMHYTRYSDDLAFSTNQVLTDEGIAEFCGEVESILQYSGFRVNRDKTRFMRDTELQCLLGLAVNTKVGILRSRYHRLRAIAANCVRNGFDSQAAHAGFSTGEELKTHLSGVLNYLHSVDQTREASLRAILGDCL